MSWLGKLFRSFFAVAPANDQAKGRCPICDAALRPSSDLIENEVGFSCDVDDMNHRYEAFVEGNDGNVVRYYRYGSQQLGYGLRIDVDNGQVHLVRRKPEALCWSVRMDMADCTLLQNFNPKNPQSLIAQITMLEALS